METSMSEAQHTPGPWSFRPIPKHREPDDIPVLAGACGIVGVGQIALVRDLWDRDGGRAGAEANARVIVAAPNMLAALNYVADMTYCGADGLWNFKESYDPKVVLDAIALTAPKDETR